MTARDASAEALRRLVSDDGAIHTRTLPGPVTDAMQAIVDCCEFRCLHVAAGDGLPAAAVPKLAIRGVPGLWCERPTCVADMAHHIALWRGVRVDDRCVLCDRQPTAFRTVFTDEAAGLSIVAWVCGPAPPSSRRGSACREIRDRCEARWWSPGPDTYGIQHDWAVARSSYIATSRVRYRDFMRFDTGAPTAGGNAQTGLLRVLTTGGSTARRGLDVPDDLRTALRPR